jgi:hypothetical protein
MLICAHNLLDILGLQRVSRPAPDLLPPFDPLGCARYVPGVLARNVAGLVEVRGHWRLQPRPSLDLPLKD